MKISRRSLLIAGGVVGGGLLVGAIGLAGTGAYLSTHELRASQLSDHDPSTGPLVAQWIRIGSDGTVALLTPHTEMGQGANTGLWQILVDELDADPGKTIVEPAPALPGFANGSVVWAMLAEQMDAPEGFLRRLADNMLHLTAASMGLQITGGSMSVRGTGFFGVRPAAAAARSMLAHAGAQHLDVDAAQVRTDTGMVVHEASKKAVDYGTIAQAASKLSVPYDPEFKPRSEWKYIGQPTPRLDIPAKVFAQAEYGIDVDVPDLRYAAVVGPPVAGATITGVKNESALTGRRGVEAVVVMDDAVAVVADNPWRAEQAVRKAELTFQEPEGGRPSDPAWEERRRKAVYEGELTTMLAEGDAAAAIQDATPDVTVVEAEYRVPHLSHTPMEPMNATLWRQDGVLHVASGVQNPLASRMYVAEWLGLPLKDVQFHAKTMGGGFGRRGALLEYNLNWLRQLVDIHKAVGGNIKLIWSREADTRLSTTRSADLARMRATLGADGKPTAWLAQTYAPMMSGHEVAPHYTVPNVTIATAKGEPALPYCYWRSVDMSSHGFFLESFVDELAHAAQQDPLDYRLSLLPADGRHAAVLRKVKAMSGWGRSLQAGRALGVAMAQSFGSIVAHVAEVSVDGKTPRVHQVWSAIDCGTAVNPDGIEAQIQGGIQYGLSAALFGEITFDDNGGVKQSNFHDYPVVRFQQAPRVQVAILESPDDPVGGVGEVAVPPIAPAVANAVAVLTERPRSLPIRLG